jgi:AraC-like DNA-binding protein
MPLSYVFSFIDAHAYEGAIRGAEAEILVTEKGAFRAELTEIDLPRLRIRRGHENLPRISRVRVPANRALLYFLAGESQSAMTVGGKDLSAGEIMVCAPNTTHHDWTAAPCGWGSISMGTDDLAAAERAVAGRDLGLASTTRFVRPDPGLGARLMNLLEIAERLAKTAPDALACPEIAQGLEQDLIDAMIKCLSEGTPVEMRRGARHHSRVIERFEQLLAANRDRPLYLAEICAATGVSERTLRACCQEHLGMGPMQYLRLRRMHLARHALMLADPAVSTVTEIATGFGFCELGRFSVEYRALFGESPSTSLQRPSEGPVRTAPFQLPREQAGTAMVN